MTPRSLLLVVSFSAHVALFGGLTVAGMWRIDKLALPSGGGAVLGLAPARAAGGGAAIPAAVRPVARVVRDVVQPTERPARPEPTTTTSATVGDGTGTGTGEGEGTGEGDGAGEGDDGGGGCVPGLGCDDGAAPLPQPVIAPPATPPPPAVIPPSLISALRISGDTHIVPDGADLTALARTGTGKATGLVRLCLDPRGAVADVALVRSTGLPGYDARLLAGVRTWRYRPYVLDGAAVPACSTVSFVFALKR
ncbi:MAG: hypothetical protein R2939_10305 [Kofleriaceae bacterium]